MASIADKGRTKEIIDRMERMLETASSVPLSSGKVAISKEEMQILLRELNGIMDHELRTYREVTDRKGKLLIEAKKEAENIIYEAEQSASRMRVSKRSTKVAPIRLEELSEEEQTALSNVDEIYAASLIYTDEMLMEVDNLIQNAYQGIRNEYELILQTMEEKVDIIHNNRMELMTGLQEMEKEERCQQILEIGELLSSELYHERMKKLEKTNEYTDGSVQMEFEFIENEQSEESPDTAKDVLELENKLEGKDMLNMNNLSEDKEIEVKGNLQKDKNSENKQATNEDEPSKVMRVPKFNVKFDKTEDAQSTVDAIEKMVNEKLKNTGQEIKEESSDSAS